MTAALLPLEGMKTGAGYMLELIWKHSESHLTETENEILIPLDIVTILGSDNLEVIKGRLSTILHAPTTAIEDKSNGVCRIRAATENEDRSDDTALKSNRTYSNVVSATTASSKGKAGQAKRQKIPRPPNAFILYRQHYHPIVKAENPSFHNNDISKLLGEQWRSESAQRKAEYKALAEQIKKRHAEEYPDYQYAPRKPSERKRRSCARRNASGKRAPTSTKGSIGSSASPAATSELYDSPFDSLREISCRVIEHGGTKMSGNDLGFAAVNPHYLGTYDEQLLLNFDCPDYVMSHNIHPMAEDPPATNQYTFQNVTELPNWTPHDFDIETGNYIEFLP